MGESQQWRDLKNRKRNTEPRKNKVGDDLASTLVKRSVPASAEALRYGLAWHAGSTTWSDQNEPPAECDWAQVNEVAHKT